MPIRVEYVEIPLAPRSILWLRRIKSSFLQMSPDLIHIRHIKDKPTPLRDRITFFQIENRRFWTLRRVENPALMLEYPLLRPGTRGYEVPESFDSCACALTLRSLRGHVLRNAHSGAE